MHASKGLWLAPVGAILAGCSLMMDVDGLACEGAACGKPAEKAVTEPSQPAPESAAEGAPTDPGAGADPGGSDGGDECGGCPGGTVCERGVCRLTGSTTCTGAIQVPPTGGTFATTVCDNSGGGALSFVCSQTSTSRRPSSIFALAPRAGGYSLAIESTAAIVLETLTESCALYTGAMCGLLTSPAVSGVSVSGARLAFGREGSGCATITVRIAPR
jgi:hypothetical protein